MKDLDDVPREIVQELRCVAVEHMDDVITVALHANKVVSLADKRVLAKPTARH